MLVRINFSQLQQLQKQQTYQDALAYVDVITPDGGLIGMIGMVGMIGMIGMLGVIGTIPCCRSRANRSS